MYFVTEDFLSCEPNIVYCLITWTKCIVTPLIINQLIMYKVSSLHISLTNAPSVIKDLYGNYTSLENGDPILNKFIDCLYLTDILWTSRKSTTITLFKQDI